MITIIEQYATYNTVQKSDFLNRLNLEPAKIAELYAYLSEEPYKRPVLRILADVSKKKNAGEAILILELKNGLIKACLFDADAKSRKTAAALIGSCCAGNYALELQTALEREDTEFVRPSIILALGKTKSSAAYAYLKSYILKNQVAKHRDEENLALQKALSALNTDKAPIMAPQIKDFTILLTCPPEHTDLTEEELDEHDIAYKRYPHLEDALMLRMEKYEKLFSCRTFYEALILLGKCTNTIDALANFLKNPKFVQSINALYGQNVLSYRIEVKGSHISHEQRKVYIETAAQAIQTPQLLNSPSNYTLELRLVIENDKILILAKPSEELDRRFDYRKNTLPASIHPVTAAALARYAYPYLKRDANVLDPFCGSGTMLFERAKVKPYRSLTGTDNQKYAINCSRQNEVLAGTGADFIQTDILEYKPKARYDEIISNMPFGIRVGSHENNTALYKGFVQAMQKLLKPQGMAFLFTNDKKLLQDTFTDSGSFTIVDEAVFYSGNMHPSLFIVKKSD